nr:Protein phosphatase 1 regulatory subunit 3A like [Ipomoea batatas]
MGSEGGAIEKQTSAAAAGNPATFSCRRKKSENATFVEDVRDHIDEFINASMDEHKTCFQKTIRKMFGMSKVVAERNAEMKEVESSLPLRTVVSD